MLCAVTVAMKLISFAHVNRSMRRSARYWLLMRAIREMEQKARTLPANFKSGSVDDSVLSSVASGGGGVAGTGIRRRVGISSAPKDKDAGVGLEGAQQHQSEKALPPSVPMSRRLQRTASLPASTVSEQLSSAQAVSWPANLTLSNVLYFVVVPTLCYQVQYPRTRRIRKAWLAKRCLEMLCTIALMAFLVEQYVIPTVANIKLVDNAGELAGTDGVVPRSCSLGASLLLERVLKLSVPYTYFWLAMFFGFFHLWFNILSELTCFADRLFYRDWWNATTLEEYWRKWNLPVHNWLVRHVYFPCVRAGCSKASAQLIVFFLSAALHELVISVPCRTVRLWAFIGMMAQAPLGIVTKLFEAKFGKSQLGNCFFWSIFCIFGQPLCVMLYYFDGWCARSVFTLPSCAVAHSSLHLLCFFCAAWLSSVVGQYW